MTAAVAGEKFGRLTVLYQLRTRIAYAVCICECGNVRKVIQSGLRNGHTKSCGCLRKDVLSKRATTHGATNSPEYVSWRAMWARCTNPRDDCYHLYGARGITVCDRWKDFALFLADMGPRPAGKTLDRFPDKDGSYQPRNCRWATAAEQSRNRRSRVVIVEYEDRRMTLAEWAREVGVGSNVVYNRINVLGWSIERALGLPGARLAGSA